MAAYSSSVSAPSFCSTLVGHAELADVVQHPGEGHRLGPVGGMPIWRAIMPAPRDTRSLWPLV